MRWHYRELRVGDRVRILAVPGRDVPGYWLHDDTRRLLEQLISRRVPLRVYRVDEWGLPWVRHRFKNEGRWEYHSLSLDEFDEWERVMADA